MICPKCGEDNSSNFRFCGMCGTALDARHPVGASKVPSAAEPIRTASNAIVETRTPVATRAAVAAEERVPPSAGPSFLGLNQPSTDTANDQVTTLRDQFFSGTESFYEPEDPNIGARRVILLLLLLAILGGGGWWAYSNYNKAGGMKRIIPILNTTPGGNENAANTPPPSSKADKTAAPNSASSQPAEPPANAPAQAGNTNPAPAAEPKAEQPKAEAPKTEQSPAASPAAKETEPEAPARSSKNARAERTNAGTSRAAARPSPEEPAEDKGNAEFRKGEAYLYGRGMRQNCDEAVRNLKEASAKQNAKARSTFGTMYATGHCVPRDLPTSYSWFALALRVDPNNQILEKDLVAIWNQMTPPERQMATRLKQ